MADCKHGIDEEWCSLCSGQLEYAAPSKPDPSDLCCAPKCPRKAVARIGSLPLCAKHQVENEKALIRTTDPIIWDVAKTTDPPKREGWVYFVQIDDVVKIGYSSDVHTRVRSFASYGHDVTLLGLERGDQALEKRLHRRFYKDRAKVGLSKELFHPSDEILEYVRHGRKCAKCRRRCRAGRVFCPNHDSDRLEIEDLIGCPIGHEEDQLAAANSA